MIHRQRQGALHKLQLKSHASAEFECELAAPPDLLHSICLPSVLASQVAPPPPVLQATVLNSTETNDAPAGLPGLLFVGAAQGSSQLVALPPWQQLGKPALSSSQVRGLGGAQGVQDGALVAQDVQGAVFQGSIQHTKTIFNIYILLI